MLLGIERPSLYHDDSTSPHQAFDAMRILTPGRLLLWLLLTALLSGCGQKGDLYLPDKKAEADTAPTVVS